MDCKTIGALISESALKLPEKVEEAVVNVFTDRECARRTDLLVKGLDKREGILRDIGKVETPDLKFTDGEGKRTEMFSEKRMSEIGKVKASLRRITDAIDVALTKADFGSLEKLVQEKTAQDGIE